MCLFSILLYTLTEDLGGGRPVTPMVTERRRLGVGMRYSAGTGVARTSRFYVCILEKEEYGTLHEFACAARAEAVLIFSVSFQF